MTKQELAQKVPTDTDITAGQAKSAVDAAFAAIAGELAGGGDVAIAGFGKFSVSERSARDGRNPATGQTIQIAARSVAKFSPAARPKKTAQQLTQQPARESYGRCWAPPMTGR